MSKCWLGTVNVMRQTDACTHGLTLGCNRHNDKQSAMYKVRNREETDQLCACGTKRGKGQVLWGKKGLSRDVEPKQFMCLADKGSKSGDHLVYIKARTRGSMEIPWGNRRRWCRNRRPNPEERRTFIACSGP